MSKAGETYTTFNRIRLALFVRSYACYAITCYLWKKYKIKIKASQKDLRKKYSKYSVPEISRLAKALNFDYAVLWDAIILDRKRRLNKKISDDKKIGLYLTIESELISLAKTKQRQSDYTDPDYEEEFGILITAIERAIGNALEDIEDDLSFAQQSEELNRKYRYLYYKVAYKYKLPTLRITPFILRLIS